jgi:hypothetical protein
MYHRRAWLAVPVDAYVAGRAQAGAIQTRRPNASGLELQRKPRAGRQAALHSPAIFFVVGHDRPRFADSAAALGKLGLGTPVSRLFGHKRLHVSRALARGACVAQIDRFLRICRSSTSGTVEELTAGRFAMPISNKSVGSCVPDVRIARSPLPASAGFGLSGTHQSPHHGASPLWTNGFSIRKILCADTRISHMPTNSPFQIE